MVAQAVQFFAAGFETTSSTISYTLHELCLQPKVQDKLREEILSNIKKYNGVTYEGLKEMKYMEMCIFGKNRRLYYPPPFRYRITSTKCWKHIKSKSNSLQFCLGISFSITYVDKKKLNATFSFCHLGIKTE